MPQPSTGPSELGTRLAEIDQRLQEIQAGLAPDARPDGGDVALSEPAAAHSEEPAPEDRPAEPAERQPSPRQGPLAALLARSRRRRSDPPSEEVAELVRMHAGLLDAVGQLARLLGERAAGAGAPSASAPVEALVSAGPFSDTRQVENFVLTLAALEPVDGVTLVGYEGADRALIEVQLADPSG